MQFARWQVWDSWPQIAMFNRIGCKLSTEEIRDVTSRIKHGPVTHNKMVVFVTSNGFPNLSPFPKQHMSQATTFQDVADVNTLSH